MGHIPWRQQVVNRGTHKPPHLICQPTQPKTPSQTKLIPKLNLGKPLFSSLPTCQKETKIKQFTLTHSAAIRVQENTKTELETGVCWLHP